jgi:hypothetical protein
MTIDSVLWLRSVAADRRVSGVGLQVATLLAGYFATHGEAELSLEGLTDAAELISLHPVREAINQLKRRGWLQAELSPNRQKGMISIVRHSRPRDRAMQMLSENPKFKLSESSQGYVIGGVKKRLARPPHPCNPGMRRPSQGERVRLKRSVATAPRGF